MIARCTHLRDRSEAPDRGSGTATGDVERTRVLAAIEEVLCAAA
jgi:hypothetical protein